jgi:hypothetical protein
MLRYKRLIILHWGQHPPERHNLLNLNIRKCPDGDSCRGGQHGPEYPGKPEVRRDNLKKAILKGRGNKDKKVSLAGLQGLDEVYADEQEYNITHGYDNIEGLGVVGATAIAAATSAVAAIAGALKQVKGLFSKGGKEEASFQSETDNAGTAASVPANIPEGEDASAPQTQASSLISKVTI